jgi:hypothetical protein
LKRLSGGSVLDAVTIVGTKYCVGGFDYLIKASRVREPEEQCLFLVLDTKSDDVLLHNGKQRLGTVAATHVKAVRETLKKLAVSESADHVIVCKLNFIADSSSHMFKQNSSFNVVPVFSVYERLARKFSNKYRKD